MLKDFSASQSHSQDPAVRDVSRPALLKSPSDSNVDYNSVCTLTVQSSGVSSTRGPEVGLLKRNTHHVKFGSWRRFFVGCFDAAVGGVRDGGNMNHHMRAESQELISCHHFNALFFLQLYSKQSEQQCDGYQPTASQRAQRDSQLTFSTQ